MKKLFTLILGITLAYSCSTSSDGNGNSTTAVVPIAPSNLTGVVASTTQINLSWTDNSTNETGFKIERKTGTGTYAVVGTTATDITTFSDTGLTQGTYTYRVYAFNLTGDSLTYSNEFTLSSLITDIDGNTYQTVTICNQTWTKSNLNVSKYRNGDVIPQVQDATQWASLTTGAWCYYNNDQANGAIYGKLYNWYAVNDPRGLAPTGWHIPSDAEWTILTDCLGGESVAGGKMKSTGTLLWQSPNTGATNSSGFTGLPAGARFRNGTFSNIMNYTNWWSSSYFASMYAYHRWLSYNSLSTQRNDQFKETGHSVRCVKD